MNKGTYSKHIETLYLWIILNENFNILLNIWKVSENREKGHRESF